MFLGSLLCTQDYVYLTDGDSKNVAQILKKEDKIQDKLYKSFW